MNMKIVVPIQFVPDLVEELLIDENGNRLDPDATRWILNEFDDQALEEAILLKEKYGGQVIVLAPDSDEVENVLYTAAAKGADQLIRLNVNFEDGANTHALARLFASQIRSMEANLVLTGSSAHSSLDGPLGSILAGFLSFPYIGYVSKVETGSEDLKLFVTKDYPGGVKAVVETSMPVVLGVVAATTPPRYVPIAKIRQAMKACKIDEQNGELDSAEGLVPTRLFLPETGERAEMIDGDVDEVADRLVAILDQEGLL
jgi:electron transfer flavoprotein beta subunit